MSPKQTPSQTIGPYFAYGLLPEDYGRRGIAANVLSGEKIGGEPVRIVGRVLDGDGTPVSDAMIEIWQANHLGRYAHPADRRDDLALEDSFRGFGRTSTDGSGNFTFDTIKPGRVPGHGNSLQAPHINVLVFARGMLSHAYTRLYFSDEASANAEDPLLGTIETARRGTLIATREEVETNVLYRLDIHLQGDQETVFFDA